MGVIFIISGLKCNANSRMPPLGIHILDNSHHVGVWTDRAKVTSDDVGQPEPIRCDVFNHLHIAKTLKKIVLRTGDDVTVSVKDLDVVIAVPIYCRDSLQNLKLENLPVKPLEIMSDAEAAVLSYRYSWVIPNSGKVLTLIFGADALEASVLKIIKGGSSKILGHAADFDLGLNNFDRRLIEKFGDDFKNTFETSISEDPLTAQAVKSAARRTREALISALKVAIKIDLAFPSDGFSAEISREDFEKVCSDLLENLFRPVEKTLTETGVTVKDLEGVVLVGNFSRYPAIKRLIEDYFKGKTIAANLEKTVARGATIKAAFLSGIIGADRFAESILEATPLSVGLRCQFNVMSFVVGGDSKVPVEKTLTYVTVKDWQSRFYIAVFLGNRLVNTQADKEAIATFRMSVPRARRGKETMDVTVKVDSTGAVTVICTVRSTKKSKSVVVKDAFSRLTRETVDQMLRYAEANKDADLKFKKRVKAYLNLEDYVYKLKHAMVDFGWKLSFFQRMMCKFAYRTEKDWLKMYHPEYTTVEEYEYRLRQLKCRCSGYLTKMKSEKTETPSEKTEKKESPKKESSSNKFEKILKSLYNKFVTETKFIK